MSLVERMARWVRHLTSRFIHLDPDRPGITILEHYYPEDGSLPTLTHVQISPYPKMDADHFHEMHMAFGKSEPFKIVRS